VRDCTAKQLKDFLGAEQESILANRRKSAQGIYHRSLVPLELAVFLPEILIIRSPLSHASSVFD